MNRERWEVREVERGGDGMVKVKGDIVKMGL